MEEKKNEEHSEHVSKKTDFKKYIEKFTKRLGFWHYVSIVLAVLLVVSVFSNGGSCAARNTSAATGKLLDFLKSSAQGSEVTIDSAEPSDGLIKVEFSIAGKKYKSYISNTGTLFFPVAYNLSAVKDASANTQEPTSYPKSDKPAFELYYMSFCPYGIQAVQGFAPVAELLGDKIDFKPHYVVYENYCGQVKCTDKPDEIKNYCLDKDGKLCSLHGVNEINEDVRQLCVFNEQKNRFWNYTLCVMSECSLSNVESCWKGCAGKSGVDAAKVEGCFKARGVELMTAEKRLNDENDVRGSPSVFLNGADYSGGRAPNDFKSAVCSAFKSAPSECSQTLSTSGEAASGNCG